MYAAASDSRTFGEPYSRVDMASEIENSDYVGAFIQMAPYYQSWKFGDQTTSENALNDAISAAADDRMAPGAALNEAAKTINDMFEELYTSTAE